MANLRQGERIEIVGEYQPGFHKFGSRAKTDYRTPEQKAAQPVFRTPQPAVKTSSTIFAPKAVPTHMQQRGAIAQQMGVQEQARAAKVAQYKQLLSVVNQIANQVKGGAWAAVIAPLKQLEIQWGKIHALKAFITSKQYKAAAQRIVAIRDQGAQVYLTDAKAHTAVMNNWAKSKDLPALEKAISAYVKWITFMNGNWTAPNSQTYYTKDLPKAKEGHHMANVAWQKMHAHWVAGKDHMVQKQQQFESEMPKLMDELGLDMTADMNTIMSTWQEKYQTKAADVTAYNELLASYGISNQAPLVDQVPVMIEFIKTKKKKMFRNVAIGAGVLAAGGAALAFT